MKRMKPNTRKRKMLHEVERCARPGGGSKASYRSKAKAEQAIRAHRHRNDYGAQLRPYECPHCGLWHITGQPQ